MRPTLALLLVALTSAWLTQAGAQTAGHLRDAQPRAVRILLDATRSDDAELRMHAIEGSKSMPDRALPLVQLALDDLNPAVRFAALVTAGRLEFESLGKKALEMSKDDQQPGYVRAAAVFAAHRCGQPADLGRLAALLWNPDIGVRSNAAMLLGLSGESSAIPMLRESANDPLTRTRPISREILRLQIAEAVVLLGSDEDLKAIRGAAYSSEDEIRILAVLMLGRLNDQGMRGNFVGFLAKSPVELRLAAAEALARMGSLEGIPVMIEAARMDQPTVRAQAAFALGQAAHDTRCAMALEGLLEDAEPKVRIAAAAAILEHLNP